MTSPALPLMFRRSPEDILDLLRQREETFGPVHAAGRAVRDVYEGRVEVPLPERAKNERAAVANLLNMGMDQTAQRIASVPPAIYCPPRDPKVKREVSQAMTRQKALYGWWEMNDYRIMQRRRARHLIGYGWAPVVLRPHARRPIPQWQVRDPLTTFPAQTVNPDDMTPDDCIFTIQRTYGWLQRHYPGQFDVLRRPGRVSPDDKVTLAEYMDEQQITLLVIGENERTQSADDFYGAMRGGSSGWVGARQVVVLEQMENRAEICPVVIPGRVTLDRLMGQFDGMLGMYEQSARMMALQVIAVEKGIFPDIVGVSRPGEQLKLISGEWQDGRTGKINILQGGDIQYRQSNPGFATTPMLHDLERSQRLTAGIPAEFGGESASNIRTGKRGDAVLSAAVDFPIQEAQELFASSGREENKRAIATVKAWYGSKPTSFYVNWKGDKGVIDYTPNEVFTTDENIVSFSHAGADVNALTIMVGQLNGMGVMSKLTTARMLPVIDDAEFEHDQTIKEALEQALLSGWQQKIAAGEVTPKDAAWVMQQVAENKLELAEAIMKVDELVQQRQASSGPPGSPTGPVDPSSPDAQPGLAAGTPAAGQAVAPSIAGPVPAQQNLSQLLGALRRPQMTVPSERGAA